MGRDGTAGPLELHGAGGLTIAQDEATSMAYGMSREAVLLGASAYILPLADIGPALANPQREMSP
jgi:two-component system, chemotaxis family, protein-glutamate methylesterase/glutaminase